jgi:hypothetical protein
VKQNRGTILISGSSVKHLVNEKIIGRIVAEGSASLAATDGKRKVKRLDKAVVTVLQ